MIILGIIATLATFVFITALIFIFFEKTKKIGKQIAPISLVLALSLFFIMGALNRESHESKTEDVTATTESTADEPSIEEDPIDYEDEEDDTIHHEVDWSVKENNVEFSIDQVSVIKQDLESGDQGMIGVHFIIDNKSNKDITTYPAQGTLLTSTREQIKANIAQSEHFDGDIMSGAKTDGFVVFPVKNLNNPEDINSVRVQWNFYPDKNTAQGVKELNAQLSFNS